MTGNLTLYYYRNKGLKVPNFQNPFSKKFAQSYGSRGYKIYRPCNLFFLDLSFFPTGQKSERKFFNLKFLSKFSVPVHTTLLRLSNTTDEPTKPKQGLIFVWPRITLRTPEAISYENEAKNKQKSA